MYENEFIDVNSFAKLANIYVKSNTPDEQILNLPNNSIVYAHDSHTAYSKVIPIFNRTKKNYILITCRDFIVDENKVKAANSNLLKWFGNNVEYKSEYTQGIPIGLPPTNAGFNEGDGTEAVDKRKIFSNIMEKTKNINNIVYINHLNHTNHGARTYLYSKFKNIDWITCKGGSSRINYTEYINDVHSHKYMLCPAGAGPDCHRVWESLYLGTIPIVKKSNSMSYFEELPIIFVNDFNEVTLDFIENEANKLQNKSMKMLKMSYWKNLIEKVLLF